MTVPRRPALPWPLLQAGPFALLALVGLRVAANWGRIPDPIAAHFRWNGAPDRWVAKTPAAVFWPLVLAFLLCGIFTALSAAVTRAPLPRFDVPGHEEGARRVRGALRAVLVGAGYLVAVIFSLIVLAVGGGHDFPAALAGTVTVIGVVGMVAGLARISVAAASMPASAGQEGVWRAGVFYVNPEDPALFVPKRYGIGYTLNFARSSAWFVMAAILAVPIGLAVFLILTVRGR